MDLRILLLLSLSAAATAVDFSQFYLPPCCYGPASATASSNINARYEKPDSKGSTSGTIHLFDPDSNSKTADRLKTAASSSDTKSQPSTKKKSPTARARLYRYIIPVGLEKREPRTSLPDSVEADSSELFRSPMSKKHANLPTTHQQQDNKSQLQKSIEKLLLSSAQVEPELVKRPTKQSRNKNSPGRAYLHETNSTTTDSDVMSKHKRNIQRLHGMNETMVAAHFDMPPNWATNLKRALFQSMDSMLSATQKKKSSKSKDETFEAKSSNHGTYQTASSEQSQQRQSHRNSRRLAYLWPKIRDANFSYVEPLGKSATSLPQTLLMPSGQGPVASGVVVNTPDGIELRMSSELHFQQDDPNSEGAGNDLACTCPLVANGEMLLAYWSVTRILNELGQNSLQYLIYPLAHNVPTPPRLQPFNTQIQISHPSQQYPVDPNEHLQQHVTYRSHQNYEELPPQLSEAPEVTEDPRFVHNAQPEYPQNQIFQNLQRFTQIPPPGRPVDDRTNFRGVVANHQVDLQQQLFSQGQQNFVTGGPQLAHPNFIPVGHPLGQTLGTSNPPLYSTGRKVHRRPQSTAPAHIQLFDGTNRPDLPKSIQDLLPFHQVTTVQPPLGAVPAGPQQIPNNFNNPAINQVVYNVERNPSEYDGVVNFANNRFPQSNIPHQQSHNFDYASIFSGIPPGSEINFHPASSLPFAGNPEFEQPITYQDRSREREEEIERFRPSTPVRERGRDFDFNNRRNQQQPQQRPFYPEHPSNPVPLEGFPSRNSNRGSNNYYERNQFPVLRHRSDRYTTSATTSRTQQPLDGRGYIIDF